MSYLTSPAPLPPDLLARLRDRIPSNRQQGGTRLNPEAMAAAALFFDICTKGDSSDWWNETINALDDCNPNWRGYSAPKVNRAIAHVLAHTSQKDAA